MTFAQRLITASQRQEVVSLEKCRDGVSCRGQNGVDHIMTDRAGTVEYLLYADHLSHRPWDIRPITRFPRHSVAKENLWHF